MSELNPPSGREEATNPPESGQRSRWRREGLICRSLEEAFTLRMDKPGCLLGSSIHHPSGLCSSLLVLLLLLSFQSFDPLLIRILWTDAPDVSRFSSDWCRGTSLVSLHRLKTINHNLYSSHVNTAVAMTMCNFQRFVETSSSVFTVTRLASCCSGLSGWSLRAGPSGPEGSGSGLYSDVLAPWPGAPWPGCWRAWSPSPSQEQKVWGVLGLAVA